MPYLAYQEPDTIIIFGISSLLLLLNGVRYFLDQFLYCGVIGEILIGTICGVPVTGTAWLSGATQNSIQAFGYLGLISLVFEGGLNIDLSMLRKSAYLSVSIACIGVLMPIALSFVLLLLPFSSDAGSMYPTPLAAFSAGASLCSTSLGTTFTLLSSANMQQTRLGVVLVGAAMLDDVVGLVMVNIVTTLGNGSREAWPIARPIVASFGLLLVTLVLTPAVLRPIWRWLRGNSEQAADPSDLLISSKTNFTKWSTTLISRIPHIVFILPTAVLLIFVGIASFIDTSILFAAFVAGGVINYLATGQPDLGTPRDSDEAIRIMYDKYYKPVVHSLLVPFFFASIGFSIPITEMFRASVVWKGLLYALVMFFAKGLVSSVVYIEHLTRILQQKPNTRTQANEQTSSNLETKRQSTSSCDLRSGPPHAVALLMAFAMITRGEIGFLIASLSQSSETLILRNSLGSFSASSHEEVFLVIVWAVVLCTITGPLGVGITVRRLKHGINASCLHWL